jgi:hypothetical protein
VNRFANEDPIGFYGGINVFAYARNAPMTWTDPTGLDMYVILYQGSTPVGHIGIGVAGNGVNSQGFYPPGQVQPDDAAEEGYPKGCLIFSTTVRQDDAVRDFIDQRKRDPGWWGPGRDCANVVHDALKAAGINVDDSMWPKTLFKNLQKLTPYSCLVQ